MQTTTKLYRQIVVASCPVMKTNIFPARKNHIIWYSVVLCCLYILLTGSVKHLCKYLYSQKSVSFSILLSCKGTKLWRCLGSWWFGGSLVLPGMTVLSPSHGPVLFLKPAQEARQGLGKASLPSRVQTGVKTSPHLASQPSQLPLFTFDTYNDTHWTET